MDNLVLGWKKKNIGCQPGEKALPHHAKQAPERWELKSDPLGRLSGIARLRGEAPHVTAFLAE